MICRCRGTTCSSRATGHFSSASGIRVWFVYAMVACVISQAVSHGQVALVDQDAHQLGHREGGMGVVELDGDLVREGVEAAVVIALVARDDVPERAGDEEVLLDETELLTGRHGVGRIEHLGDGLRGDLLLHGLHVVAGVEDLHVEVVRRPCGEEPEQVHRPAAVADDGIVVGHADQEPPVQPHRVVLAPAVDPVLDAAIDGDEAGLLGPLDLPGRREGEPVVRLLLLLAVLDLLAEQAVLVVDAVAVAGHVERGQRIEEAGREPAQPAVAERGVALALFHVGEVGPEVSAACPGRDRRCPRLIRLLAGTVRAGTRWRGSTRAWRPPAAGAAGSARSPSIIRSRTASPTHWKSWRGERVSHGWATEYRACRVMASRSGGAGASGHSLHGQSRVSGTMVSMLP